MTDLINNGMDEKAKRLIAEFVDGLYESPSLEDYERHLENTEQNLEPKQFDEPGLETPEPDLDDEETLSDEEDDSVYNGRIKSGVLRVYRALGEENANPVMVLKALERLQQGRVPQGPLARSLSPLSGGLMNILEDPTQVNLLLRIIANTTADPLD